MDIMYSADVTDELNVLMLFDLANHQEGIKIHKASADQKSIDAAQRLFDKGLVSQKDGGYLTTLGLDAAEHAQNLFTILTTK